MSESMLDRRVAALGEPEVVPLCEIADDPRWGVDAGSDEECLREAAREAREPIVCRRVGGRIVCVSPAERVAAIRRAAQLEGAEAVPVEAHVLDGVSDEDADVVRRAVSHLASEEGSDAWRDGVGLLKEEFDAMEGRPWMKTSSWRMLAALSGTYHTLFYRITALQEHGTDELRSLVDDGLMTIRAAADGAKLSEDAQRSLAAEVRGRGELTKTEAARLVRKYRPAPARTAAEIDAELRELTRAVMRGDAKPSMEQAVVLQMDAVALLSATFAAVQRRRKAVR